MVTAIVSNIKQVNVELSYDDLLGKYCLQICTNDGIVEMILKAHHLIRLVEQLQQLPGKLAATVN